jgi:Tfp pilus assembly protein PilN
MQAVNLLPAEARVSKSAFASVGAALPGKRTLQIGGALAALLAVGFAALYVHERSIVHSRKAKLAETQARVVAVQSQVEAVKSAQALAAQRMAVVSSVAQSRMNWDRALGDLARVLPVDVFLTNLTAGAPVTAAAAPAAAGATAQTAAAPAVSSSLTITGDAPSHVRVALVLDRLAVLPWLNNITLSSSSRQAAGDTTFTINAAVTEEH